MSSRPNAQDRMLTGERINLMANLDVGAKETLVIYTHLDVVPTHGDWSTDPIRACEKERQGLRPRSF